MIVHGTDWRWLSLTSSCIFLLAVAAIDLRYRLVPDALVLPAALMVLLMRAIPVSRGTLSALLGAAVGLLPFLLVALLKPGTLGGGDIKLAAVIGLAAGFPRVLWPISLGIVTGGLVSMALLLSRRYRTESTIPYAPFLCLGALVSLLYSPI